MKLIVTLLSAINVRECVQTKFYENYHQVRVNAKPESLDLLRDTLSQFDTIDIWTPLDDKHDHVVFSISQTEMKSLTAGLSDFDFYIESYDLSRRIRKDHKNSENLRNVDPSDYPFDVYLNGDQYNSWLDDVVQRYPNNIMTQSFGLTYEVGNTLRPFEKCSGSSCKWVHFAQGRSSR